MTHRAPRSIADAYSTGGVAWARGPARVYGPLAELLVADSPVPLAGRLVLDVGSGTGVASRAALAAGGPVLASTYAEDDTHPVREAVDEALTAAGFVAPRFYVEVKQQAVPRLATVDRVAAAARAAGLTVVDVVPRRVPFPDLEPDDPLAWRLGMAQYTWFLDALSDERRAAIEADARDRVGRTPPTLVRSVIHLLARAP